MSKIDKRGRLSEEAFAFRANKEGKVFITWHGKQVTILRGKAAKRFLEKADGLDALGAQLLMAKTTGNFKRGNESS